MLVRIINVVFKYFFMLLFKDCFCLSLGIIEILIIRCGNVLKLLFMCLVSWVGRGWIRRVLCDVCMILVW